MADEPAFPVPDVGAYQYPGMSLRDWFAGKAIGAIIVVTSAGQHNPGDGPDDDRSIRERMAFDAFSLADAMLAARKEQTNEDR